MRSLKTNVPASAAKATHAAAQFLDHLLAALPFLVQAIQDQGGSGFTAAFKAVRSSAPTAS